MVYRPSVAFLLCIITHNQHAAIGASTKRISDLIPANFPELISNRYGIGDIPQECVDKTYCTIRPASYPEKLFNKMFKDMTPLRLPSLVMKTILDGRQGNPREQDDCDSTVNFDPIYLVRANLKSEWTDVVQAPLFGYQQQIRLEICMQPFAPCFNVFPPTPDNRVFCSQKFSPWNMIVMNGTEMVELEVKLPTCCSCVYQTVSLGTGSEK